MSDLFRQSTPAPGRFSRKLFFYLTFGVLFYSGFHSAIETFKQQTAASVVRLDVIKSDKDSFGGAITSKHAAPDSRTRRHHNLVSVPAFRNEPRS